MVGRLGAVELGAGVGGPTLSKDRREPVGGMPRAIDEATRYAPVEDLARSQQCGFAPDDLDTLTSWDHQ